MTVQQSSIQADQRAPALPILEGLGGEVFWVERPGGIRLRACRLEGKPAAGKSGRTLLFLHGYTEFLEKYAFEIFGRLQEMGYTVWSFDWRGQGLSTRSTPDRLKGHLDSFEDHLDDAKAMLAKVVEQDDGNIVLVGHSMGGHLALRLLAEKGQAIGEAVVLSPMIGIDTKGIPVWVSRLLLGALKMFGQAESYPPGVKPFDPAKRAFNDNILTTHKQRFGFLRQAVTEDPDLAIGAPTVGWAAAAFKSIATLNRPEYLARIKVPVTFFLSGSDRVVDNKAAKAIVPLIAQASLLEIPGAEHELLMEQDAFQTPVWTKFEELI